MENQNEELPPIWGAFCRALGTEYRDTKEIRGASGLAHPVEAIGVDDKNKRIVLVSSEFNPRISALMRGDVQATLPGMRVLVARPLAVDLAHAARKIFFTPIGTLDIEKLLQLAALSQSEVQPKADDIGELLGPEAEVLFRGVKQSSLRISTILMNVIDQFSNFDWDRVSNPLEDKNFLQSATDILSQFSELDNLLGDRKQGICPIPTYELTEKDWDLFHENRHIDEIRERLKSLDIYQFFYPPADRLALGLMDYGISSKDEIASGFQLAETQGHEVSTNSLVPGAKDLLETLEVLKSEGYVMEGQFSNELTAEGEVVRQEIKVRPSEGLLTKISQIMSLKVDLNLKDLIGGK